jgi:hypothetical protein
MNQPNYIEQREKGYWIRDTRVSLESVVYRLWNCMALTTLVFCYWAAQQGRVLVSHDRRTLPSYFERFIRSQRSPGLMIVSQRLPIGTVAELLHLLWAASDAEEYVNAVYELSSLR